MNLLDVPRRNTFVRFLKLLMRFILLYLQPVHGRCKPYRIPSETALYVLNGDFQVIVAFTLLLVAKQIQLLRRPRTDEVNRSYSY